MSQTLTEISEKEFNDFLKPGNKAIVEFGAPWCGACKVTEPIVAEISKFFPKINFVKVDVSKNAMLASKMGVMSLPNIIFINDGKVVNQMIGSATKKSLEDKITKAFA